MHGAPALSKGPGAACGVKVEIVARDAQGNITGRYENAHDLATLQMAQLVQNNILATAEAVTDTGNASRSLSANSATSVPRIVAGIGATAAAYNDYALQTPTAGTSGYVAATINAASGSGTSCSFTVTGTITNTSGSSVSYGEVGITIVCATYTFLLCHDVFSALPVSNNGTLAVTYTLTYSA